MKDKSLSRKLSCLEKNIKSLNSCLVAFSGGVDSSFLLKIASDILKDKAIAVTLKTFFIADKEIEEARNISNAMGVKHIILSVDFTRNRKFLNNTPNRCYWCKRKIFKKLKDIANRCGMDTVVDGTTFDDVNDYRPGLRAIKELKVNSPLKDAKILKSEVRLLSRRMKLPFWNKPSTTCLCSRIPFGEKVTLSRIKRIEKAEILLRSLLGGNTIFRLREHKDFARIEIEKKKIGYFLRHKNLDKLTRSLKKIGYRYITLDLEGYKAGGNFRM